MKSTTTENTTAEHSLPAGGEWFCGAGLGVFIHWDHASQQGIELSWPVVWGTREAPGPGAQPLSVAEYHASAATFDPQKWDAKAFAVLLAETGVTYAVLTTRHHAGYAMFESNHSDFGVLHSPVGRDLVAEYVEALHEVGVRVGFYYSLSDWHHVDYPAFTDADRPYPQEHWVAGQREPDPCWTSRHRRADPEAWGRYQAYLRGQLTELLTRYGQVDLLWFDGEWERSAEEWDTAGLRELIRELQPAVVVNDRLLEQGDYATPEQGMPRDVPDGPWELCLTIGDTWGYSPADTRRKSPRSLAATLSQVVSRGGNLLLNVGPSGSGALPDQVETVQALGGWVQQHREALLGVEAAPDVDFYGPVTRRRHEDGSESVYLHLLALPVETVTARRLPVARLREATLLATGERLSTSTAVDVHGSGGAEHLGEVQIAAPPPSEALVDVVRIDLTPAS